MRLLRIPPPYLPAAPCKIKTDCGCRPVYTHSMLHARKIQLLISTSAHFNKRSWEEIRATFLVTWLWNRIIFPACARKWSITPLEERNQWIINVHGGQFSYTCENFLTNLPSFILPHPSLWNIISQLFTINNIPLFIASATFVKLFLLSYRDPNHGCHAP